MCQSVIIWAKEESNRTEKVLRNNYYISNYSDIKYTNTFFIHILITQKVDIKESTCWVSYKSRLILSS
jgi:hypothetical protein